MQCCLQRWRLHQSCPQLLLCQRLCRPLCPPRPAQRPQRPLRPWLLACLHPRQCLPRPPLCFRHQWPRQSHQAHRLLYRRSALRLLWLPRHLSLSPHHLRRLCSQSRLHLCRRQRLLQQ